MSKLTTDVYLIVEGKDRRAGEYRTASVVNVRQKAPRLEPGQVAIRTRVEIDSSMFDPKPTPTTTIVVETPVYPEPVAEVTELEPAPVGEIVDED